MMQGQPKPLGGRQIDDKLELGQPLDWQIARLGAPKETADVESSMTISFRHTIAVAHKPASGDELAVRIMPGIAWRVARPAICSRRLNKNGSPLTTRPPACC